MRGVVAEELQGFGASRGDDLERGVGPDRVGEVAFRAVHLRGKRRLGETGADFARDFRRRDGLRVTAHGSIGQGYGETFGGSGGLTHGSDPVSGLFMSKRTAQRACA